MKEIIRTVLSQLNESVLEDVCDKFKPWSSKKQVLVNRGSIADKLFFLNSGYAILKIKAKHTEWVRHIAQPCEFITAIESFESNVPSQECIFTIGKADIYYLYREDLELLRDKYKEVNTIYHNHLVKSLIACQKRVEDLLCLEAEQYYEKLLEEKKSIMLSIPQYELASYLGIKPQSLSRIRGSLRFS